MGDGIRYQVIEDTRGLFGLIIRVKPELINMDTFWFYN
jgi:hypothetical protein